MDGRVKMRHASRTRPVIAGVLVLAMMLAVTGLLGAAGATARLTSPKSGAKVTGVITVQATVKADQKVSYVILGVDDDRPQSSNSAPYSFELDTRALTDGAHRIFVEVYDKYGLVGSSSVTTIYVRNNASSAQQVKKPAETRVAARPAAPTKTAKAPSAPPARSAAPAAGLSGAQVAAAPAAADKSASLSPMMSARGPMPAPTHAAADAAIAASSPDALVTSARTSVAVAPMASRPPMPQMAAPSVRAHTVVLNGRPVLFDVSPRIANGRLEAGFRSMFESQGAKVTWHPETRTAKSVSGALTVEVPVGQTVARVNGAPVDMGAQASITQGRTIVPVRFFASVVGAGLYWDGETRTALVQMPDRQIAVRAAAE
jgi:hypothetical protein